MDCPAHKKLTETVNSLDEKVDGMYKTQGSILDHNAKMFAALDEIKEGMIVEVGNGHSIKMPMNEVLGKLVDDENIRKILFTRTEKTFWHRWGKTTITLGLSIVLTVFGFFGKVVLSYQQKQNAIQEEQLVNQKAILINQQSIKEWIKVDSTNGERRERDINTIKDILLKKYKVVF